MAYLRTLSNMYLSSHSHVDLLYVLQWVCFKLSTNVERSWGNYETVYSTQQIPNALYWTQVLRNSLPEKNLGKRKCSTSSRNHYCVRRELSSWIASPSCCVRKGNTTEWTISSTYHHGVSVARIATIRVLLSNERHTRPTPFFWHSDSERLQTRFCRSPRRSTNADSSQSVLVDEFILLMASRWAQLPYYLLATEFQIERAQYHSKHHDRCVQVRNMRRNAFRPVFGSYISVPFSY